MKVKYQFLSPDQTEITVTTTMRLWEWRELVSKIMSANMKIYQCADGSTIVTDSTEDHANKSPNKFRSELESIIARVERDFISEGRQETKQSEPTDPATTGEDV